MKKYKVKKLYQGFASLRDYLVHNCLNKKIGIIIEYDSKIMTIPYGKLKTFQLHTHMFQSKFNNICYGLIDFKFIPDNTNDSQMELFK